MFSAKALQSSSVEEWCRKNYSLLQKTMITINDFDPRAQRYARFYLNLETDNDN